MKTGKVFIIGTGPGNVKLLTVRAAECIRKSDIIVYDRLIDEKVLDLASDKAGFVYVGKKAGQHPVPQDEINHTLLKYALEGKTVARVKGGDPFVFGRGGEECEFLRSHGVVYEVVPGITSAIAAPAYAGIPVTHRDYASSLHILTGHKGENAGDEMDYPTLAKLKGTLVFLMGIQNIYNICSGLLNAGKPEDTPAAVIENGAGPNQRILTGTVSTITNKASSAGIQSPAIIVIGHVAQLSEKLDWYRKGPLSGKKIIVTRPAGQSQDLAYKLEELGAHVIEAPVIKIVGVEDDGALKKALKQIHEYRWMVFTSANGVEHFFKKMADFGMDIRSLAGLKIAVVGSATGENLLKKGIYADYIPESFTTSDLLEGLLKVIKSEEKVLLFRSEIASDVLTEGFQKHHIAYDDIAVYQTLENTDPDVKSLLQDLESQQVDYITLTSPSTAKAFCSLLGKDKIDNIRASIVCIGPVTGAAAEDLGLKVCGIAQQYTDDGLVKRIVELAGIEGKEECHGDEEEAETIKS